MKVLISSEEIQQAILKIRPKKIAVAYIGKDYEQFINHVDKIEKIVISPTIGSNPRAIGSLVSTLGWNKVYFLDNLHAKIYIGKSAAVITSANLSRNGLDIDENTSLIEIGVLIDEKDELIKINHKFDEILNIAEDEHTGYPNEKSKIVRLDKLHKDRRKANRYGFKGFANNVSGNDFLSYTPEKNGSFKVVWYTTNDMELNWDSVMRAFPGQEKEAVENNLANYFNVAKNDDIQENEWILYWKLTNDNKVDKRISPKWMYIHHKIPNGSESDSKEYPDLIIETKNEKIDAMPFTIDKAFEKAFGKVIEQEEFSVFRDEQGGIWRISNTVDKFDSLVKALKSEYLLILQHKNISV